jgi:type I restriction enzyme S subunit
MSTEQIKPGYKRTEVGVIPEEWSSKSVRELGSVVTGGTPATDIRRYWGGQHPWITPTDIDGARDMCESHRMLTDSGLRAIRALPPNTVLVTCIASIGKNAILRKIGGCNQQINALIPNEKHDADYLYYMFEAGKGHLLANAGTTATSIVSKATFESLEFPIPTRSEQYAIATALSDVDALLTKLDQLIAKKRDLKQATMQQLLTGQTRLPGFSGAWEVKRLDALADIRSGGTPSTGVPKFWNGEVLWCTPTDITGLDGYKYLSQTSRTITHAGGSV